MGTFNRITERFAEDEQIENTFKFTIWLSVTALLIKGAIALLQQGALITAGIVLLVTVGLALQAFWFGVQRIMVPFVQALLPGTNYGETAEKLMAVPREHRLRIMRNLLLTWQTGVFVVVYVGFFYVVLQTLTALLLQGAAKP